MSEYGYITRDDWHGMTATDPAEIISVGSHESVDLAEESVASSVMADSWGGAELVRGRVCSFMIVNSLEVVDLYERVFKHGWSYIKTISFNVDIRVTVRPGDHSDM